MAVERPYFYGYQAICVFCCHRDLDMVRLGHVNPCGRVRWEGHKHCLPKWQDGACGDFRPLPEAAAREEEPSDEPRTGRKRINLRPPGNYEETVFAEAHRRGIPVEQVIEEAFAKFDAEHADESEEATE